MAAEGEQTTAECAKVDEPLTAGSQTVPAHAGNLAKSSLALRKLGAFCARWKSRHETEVAIKRFYFHLRAGDELTPDEEGTALPDFSAAKREALLCARELLAEAIRSGQQRVPDAFVIADQAGQTLDIFSLAAVLPEPLRGKTASVGGTFFCKSLS